MSSPVKVLSQLGDFSTKEFLSTYWQKKPLLIPRALPNFQSPLSADELAGFALDDDVNSRLVIETQELRLWSVEHGPFSEDRFSSLPQSHWSLLVQHVDQLHPQVNELLNYFRFIPNWRLDDIMVSYACDGGSVGPHFDYYDVFLLQGHGKRLWKIGQHCNADSALLPNQDMKILKNFKAQSEWELAPGDMLYLPPQIAHHGIAIGESMTYSIGFRAPSYAEIALEHAQELASRLTEDDRYEDDKHALQNHPGEIPAAVVENLSKTLENMAADTGAIQDWLGSLASRLSHESLIHTDELRYDNCKNDLWSLPTTSRCVYFAEKSQAKCFINGDKFFCSLEFAQILSSYQPFKLAKLQQQDKECADELFAMSKLSPWQSEFYNG